jgi:cobalt-zinc-cadmium efflux system membrane fusion protein
MLSSRRTAVWAGAIGTSVLAVALAARFTRAGPAAPAESRDMRVDKDTIAIAAGAPQWRYLRLGSVGEAVAHWSDAVPARITIDETRASKVGTPLPGRVTRVFVELGQPVAAGDPLFSVKSPDIAELRAGREKAAVDLEAARKALDRVKALVATRALPGKEEVSALQQFRQAELAQRLADAKLGSLEVSAQAENAFTVKAPRSGVVVEKNVLVDQQVTAEAGGALMVVADLSAVWAVADLFEPQAVDVTEGSPAELTSPSLPGLSFAGRVERVYAVVDPARHTIPVRVRLANPQRQLRPNVYARVRFAIAARTASLEVPATALVSDGERQYVYVQSGDGRFARREVVTGPAHEGRVPVLSGLSRGETIVEDGAILLDNQMAIAQGD